MVVMKNSEKENIAITSDRKALTVKRNVQGILALVASLLALTLVIGGSIFSFAEAIKENSKSQEDETAANGNLSGNITQNAEIPQEHLDILGGFDAELEEIDRNIKNIESEIEKSLLSSLHEEKIFVKELYDRKAEALLAKLVLCKEYSATCVAWAEQTRELLAEPIAKYEEAYDVYKERLSVIYEVGFPDLSEVFNTSESIMDFVTGNAMLDEVEFYDKELANKVADLYSVVEDGLTVVKYYLARSEQYSSTEESAEKEFFTCALEASSYLDEVCKNKDTYNYFVQYRAEQHQRFSRLLSEAVNKNGSAGRDVQHSFPVNDEYFYTDYIGYGHESRMEWKFGEYVSVFHYGTDIHTAQQYADVMASADGKVVYADYCPVRGYTVALLHRDNVITVYSGCSLIKAELGSEVKEGDIIALSGMSGESDEFKVTFEVFAGGDFADPEHYIAMPDVSLSEN